MGTELSAYRKAPILDDRPWSSLEKINTRKNKKKVIARAYIEITNVCNLNCDFCPKHQREKRQLTPEEFDLLTDKLQGKVSFLYFHLMGEPLLHPNLSEFITMARQKGFKTVLTSNGTLLHRAMALLDSLPHKIQLSLHSHESNERGELPEYINKVMLFSIKAAENGTCMVLRLWNQGGRDKENAEVMRLIEQYVPQPWKERPDGFRLRDNLYLEFDRKFEWPEVADSAAPAAGSVSPAEQASIAAKDDRPWSSPATQYFCQALLKQIAVQADGTLVPCCLDHDGDVPLGNLLHQSLEEILDSPRAQALIDGFRHHRATERLCQNCESALAHNSFRGHRRGGS